MDPWTALLPLATSGRAREFAAFIKGEVETNTALLRESGFKPE